MRAEIQKLEARVAELDRQRSRSGQAKAEQLTLEVAARQQLLRASRLSSVQSKPRKTCSSAASERITDLGASLANSRPANEPRHKRNLQLDVGPSLTVASRISSQRWLPMTTWPQQQQPSATKQPELLPLESAPSMGATHERDGDRHRSSEGRATNPRASSSSPLAARNVDYRSSSNVMTIGRGHASDIRIASHFVSRLHAKVRTDEGATIIEDAGSKNGVLVNSQRIRPAGPAPRRHREPRRRFQPAIRRQHALNPFGRGDLRARTA